jgi:hypothetical protein
VLAFWIPANARNPPKKSFEEHMPLSIPEPLKLEHDDLHQELVRATQAGGRVGEAAKAVAKVLHHHFLDEEEFALPPLGLLAQVARGEPVPDPDRAIALAQRLKRELPRMLSEHKAIVAALNELVAAARAEERPEFARFAEKLILHARTEEEVMYPAAILVGEWLQHAAGEQHALADIK